VVNEIKEKVKNAKHIDEERIYQEDVKSILDELGFTE